MVGGILSARRLGRRAGGHRLVAELDAFGFGGLVDIAIDDIGDATAAERSAFVNSAAFQQRAARGIRQGLSERDAIRDALRRTEAQIASSGRYAVSTSWQVERERRSIAAQAGGKVRLAKQWDATLDHRTCPVCMGSHGETTFLEEPFSHGTPGAVHPGCRCIEVIRPAWWLGLHREGERNPGLGFVEETPRSPAAPVTRPAKLPPPPKLPVAPAPMLPPAPAAAATSRAPMRPRRRQPRAIAREPRRAPEQVLRRQANVAARRAVKASAIVVRTERAEFTQALSNAEALVRQQATARREQARAAEQARRAAVETERAAKREGAEFQKRLRAAEKARLAESRQAAKRDAEEVRQARRAARETAPKTVAPMARSAQPPPRRALSEVHASAPLAAQLPELGRERAAAIDAEAARQLARLPKATQHAVGQFSNGYDWTIRQIELGRPKSEILEERRLHCIESGKPKDASPKRLEKHWREAEKATAGVKRFWGVAAPTAGVGTVYRGIGGVAPDVVEKMVNSATFSLRGQTTSTSMSPGIAHMFLGANSKEGAWNVMLEVEQKSGVYIEPISRSKGEFEVLLKGDAKLRVTSVERIDLHSTSGYGSFLIKVVEE